MEPNKFDKQFSEKLNSREINPSENSWDRLDAMLAINEKQSQKKSFGWLYVAASLALLMSIGLYFLNQNNNQNGVEKNSNPVVIENNSTQKDTLISEEKIINNEPINTRKTEIVTTKRIEKSNQKTIINPEKILKKSELVSVEKVIPIAIGNENKITEKTTEISNQNQIKVNPKELLAAIENPDKIQKTEKQISKIKINSASLLSSVEGEIKQNYRESIFEKAGRNLNQIKVAVANRNQE